MWLFSGSPRSLKSSLESASLCYFKENYVGEARSATQAPTVLLSERAAPEPRTEDGAASRSNATFSVRSEGRGNGCR